MVAIRLERVSRLAPLVVVAVAGIAWSILLASGHSSGFVASFVMWNVMMVAMMLPSLVPWTMLFEPAQSVRFSLGYFAVWGVYCVAAAAAQQRFHVSGGAAAAILIIAGAFQFTPMKQACLRKCRSPLGHVLTHWRSGPGFWVRVGLGHGMNCLGCCWALMAVAFALGVMNLAWMAALTVLIAAETMLPQGELASRVTGAALVCLGLGWLAI